MKWKSIIAGLATLITFITFFSLEGPEIIEKYFHPPKPEEPIVRDTSKIQLDTQYVYLSTSAPYDHISTKVNKMESNSKSTLTDPINPINTESKSEKISFHSYVNTFITNSSENIDVSVIVVDNAGNPAMSESDAIADIYKRTGKTGTVGLLRNSFTHRPEFEELQQGNSEVIEKLKLDRHTDYLAIGKVKYAIRSGTLVSGTIVCNASISMSIISINDKTIAQSFTIANANGNGATESQAQEKALQKLLDKYYNEHSFL